MLFICYYPIVYSCYIRINTLIKFTRHNNKHWILSEEKSLRFSCLANLLFYLLFWTLKRSQIVAGGVSLIFFLYSSPHHHSTSFINLSPLHQQHNETTPPPARRVSQPAKQFIFFAPNNFFYDKYFLFGAHKRYRH